MKLSARNVLKGKVIEVKKGSTTLGRMSAGMPAPDSPTPGSPAPEI